MAYFNTKKISIFDFLKKHQIMKELYSVKIEEIYTAFLEFLPDLSFAIIFFLLGILIIRLLKKQVFARVVRRAKDPVASQFVTDIVTGIFYIFLVVLTFKVIGLSKYFQWSRSYIPSLVWCTRRKITERYGFDD